jgi:protein involved in polysaccharide export with SLBB domain
MGRVDEDGTLFLLPAGKVTLAGLSAFEAQSAIEAALSAYVVSPHCEVEILKRAYQPTVYVFGAVGGGSGTGEKGIVPLKRGDRLLDVLAEVGGLSDDAYGRSVKVIRVHDQKVAMISVSLNDIMRRGQVNQNVPLQDQDIVFVPRRFYTGFREVMSVLGSLLPWYYFANNFL